MSIDSFSLEMPEKQYLTKNKWSSTDILPINSENNKFIDLLTKKYISYEKSYKLAIKLKKVIYGVQGVLAGSFILIAIPAVALIPGLFMIVITMPTFALLLCPLHKLTRKDKLKYCMVFYEYLINEAVQKSEINSEFLTFYDKSIRLFESSPMFCKPYKRYCR